MALTIVGFYPRSLPMLETSCQLFETDDIEEAIDQACAQGIAVCCVFEGERSPVDGLDFVEFPEKTAESADGLKDQIARLTGQGLDVEGFLRHAEQWVSETVKQHSPGIGPVLSMYWNPSQKAGRQQ